MAKWLHIEESPIDKSMFVAGAARAGRSKQEYVLTLRKVLVVNNKKLFWNDGNVDQKIIDDYYADLTARNFSPHTCASAIEISRPVNLKKCLRAIDICNCIVRAVPDEEIVDAKAIIGKYGLGCEPASAATIAGLKHLRADNIIGADERVACVLTGHPLKDPDVTVNYHKEKQGQFSNMPIEAPNELDAIIKLIQS